MGDSNMHEFATGVASGVDPHDASDEINRRLDRSTPEARVLYGELARIMPADRAVERANNIAAGLEVADDESERAFAVEQGLRVATNDVIHALTERCLRALGRIQRKGE